MFASDASSMASPTLFYDGYPAGGLLFPFAGANAVSAITSAYRLRQGIIDLAQPSDDHGVVEFPKRWIPAPRERHGGRSYSDRWPELPRLNEP
jgi:hypothetical protein